MARLKSNSLKLIRLRKKLMAISRPKALTIEERKALADELSAVMDALERDLSALVQKEFEALQDAIHTCSSEEELLRVANVIHSHRA